MKDTSLARVVGLMCLLIGVWTAVYWLYEPRDPPVTFDQRHASRQPGDDEYESITNATMAEVVPPIQQQRRAQPQTQERTNSQSLTRREPAPTVTPPPAPPTRQPEQPATRVIPPEYWEYTVQRGDASMESIAKKLLGAGRLWVKIAEANPLVDASKLIPGRTKLRIPKDLTNIQGKEVANPQHTPGDATHPPETAPATTPSTPPPSKPATRDYVVKSGDTLSSIAKSFYGKSALWRKIYEANVNVIEDADNLKPGVTIRIPPEE